MPNTISKPALLVMLTQLKSTLQESYDIEAFDSILKDSDNLTSLEILFMLTYLFLEDQGYHATAIGNLIASYIPNLDTADQLIRAPLAEKVLSNWLAIYGEPSDVFYRWVKANSPSASLMIIKAIGLIYSNTQQPSNGSIAYLTDFLARSPLASMKHFSDCMQDYLSPKEYKQLTTALPTLSSGIEILCYLKTIITVENKEDPRIALFANLIACQGDSQPAPSESFVTGANLSESIVKLLERPRIVPSRAEMFFMVRPPTSPPAPEAADSKHSASCTYL